MSAYDDPELLQRFRDAMLTSLIGRNPTVMSPTTDETHENHGVEVLADSTASLEIPQHMLNGTHDLRQSGAINHENHGFSGEGFVEGRAEVVTDDELARRDAVLSPVVTGVQAPPSTPEFVARARATSTNEKRRRPGGLSTSIHAPPRDANVKTDSAVKTAADVKTDANAKTDSYIKTRSSSISTGVYIDGNATPADGNKVSSGLGSSWGSIGSPRSSLVFETKPLATSADLQSINAAALLVGEKYTSLSRNKSNSNDDTAGQVVPHPAEKLVTRPLLHDRQESSKDSYLNSDTFDSDHWHDIHTAIVAQAVDVTTFDHRRWEIVEAAARVGCLDKKIALAAKIPLARATPPGRGLESYRAPVVADGQVPAEFLVDAVRDVVTTEEVGSTPQKSNDTDKTVASSPASHSTAAGKGFMGPSYDSYEPRPKEQALYEDLVTNESQVSSHKGGKMRTDETTLVERAKHVAKTVDSIPAAYPKRSIVSYLTTSPTISKPVLSPTTAGKTQEIGSSKSYGDFFEAWPAVQVRSTPGARIRRARITRLPLGADAHFVARLVYGGKLECISMLEKGISADIVFVDPEACKRFCDENANGIDYGTDKNQFVLVEAAKEPEVLSSRIRQVLDNDGSRCVRAVGRNGELKIKEDLAQRPELRLLRVEHVVDDTSDFAAKGIRRVLFRFCKITDAIVFKAYLERDEDWETFNVQFGKDPCERAANEGFCERA